MHARALPAVQATSAATSASLLFMVTIKYITDTDHLVGELGEVARSRLDRGVA